MYPTVDDPAYGAFVASQISSVVEAGVETQVEFINGRRAKTEYLRALWRISQLARHGRFDLVHAHYGLTGVIAILQDLPLVVTLYGDDLLGTPNGHGGITLASRIGRIASQLAVRRADAVICMSEQMRQALPRSVDRARAHVIPNGVDVRRFAPGDRVAARDRLGEDADVRLVLFPSTPTVARKRLDLAEAAVHLLNIQGVAARLWVVTKVPQDRLPDYYRAADCLLLTSDWEGSPNVVKEALCCDLPVVSVNVGDVEQWLALVPGCHIVEREPEAIARGISAALLARKRVDGSRVREELGLGRIGDQVVEVYREALARRRRSNENG